jgi:hypothetical protein
MLSAQVRTDSREVLGARQSNREKMSVNEL